MMFSDRNSPPSGAMRRWFGASLALLFLMFAVIFRDTGIMLSGPLVVVAVIVAGVYYGRPSSQPRIIRGWQIVTFPLAWLMTHVLLSLVFYGLFFPIGWSMRRFGYDPLRLRRISRKGRSATDRSGKDGSSPTTWVVREQNEDASRYFKQF